MPQSNNRQSTMIALLVAITLSLLMGCAGKDGATETEANTEASVAPEPITGTNWKAVKIFSADADAAVSQLNITDDSTINGNTGCNNYQGPIEIAGTTMEVGLLATTRKMCEPAVSGQERAFLEALAAARTWTRTGGTLLLLDENSKVSMELSLFNEQ